MAQSGQVRQRVTEQQLIGLLDQVEGNSADGSGTASKITVGLSLYSSLRPSYH